jgi:hypothetical protein
LSALRIALYYRLKEQGLELARRILEEDPDFETPRQKTEAELLAGHVLLVDGREFDSAPHLARVLLDRADQTILAARPSKQSRKYIEIREMGLMAMLRILGRKPRDVGGISRVTGYCPIKRYVGLETIEDSERWAGIIEKIDGWIAAD